MVDLSQFSKSVRQNPLAGSKAGLDRLLLGMRRIQSVLDREQVSAIRTLEMKISDGGPEAQRIEPHILGLSGIELRERNRVIAHRHALTGTHNWYALSTLSAETIEPKLNSLVDAYLRTINPTFTAALGDPLEISVFKILSEMRSQNRRFVFFGSFDLSQRLQSGRYAKVEPTINVGDATLEGPPDFYFIDPTSGEPAIIECKNVREWIYPSSHLMKSLVAKALAANMTPILIARRLPFITKHALCAPAGIVAHETYNQLYPETEEAQSLAELVKDKRNLGYSDIRVTEAPLPRTVEFFTKILPSLLPVAAEKFQQNRAALADWVNNEITWTKLREILSGDYEEPDIGMDF